MIRDLASILDDRLDFTDHIANVRKRASVFISLIFRIFRSSSFFRPRILEEDLVRSVFSRGWVYVSHGQLTHFVNVNL